MSVPPDPLPDARPVVGISSCLLGREVRYDGRHKRHEWLADVLATRVRYVPICPEVEAGFGVPRAPIRLEREPGQTDPRIRRVGSRDDVTHELHAWAAARLEGLEELDGYVLKAGSPSCGRKAVPVHDAEGHKVDENAGFFAWALRTRWPAIQIVDEQDLEDPEIRRAFLLSVGLHHRARTEGRGS